MLTDYYKIYTLYKYTPGGDFTASTWVSLGAKKGFIQPVGGGEQYRQGKAGEQGTHRLYTAVSVDAEYGDKVEQGGQSYKVLYSIMPAGISGMNRHKEIVLSVFE